MIRLTATALVSSVVLTACGPGDQAPQPADKAEPQTTVDAPVADDAPSDIADVPAPTNEIATIGYPDGWVMQDYWSGEYPNAFSVTGEGVTVMGHETITYGEYPPIYCGLPNKATYSPWNAPRAESDALRFVAMTFPTTFTIKEDATIEIFQDGDQGPEMLELKAGDVLTYKSYLAEGFFIAEKDGVEYEMNEAELPQSTDFEQGPEDQEWVQVTCDDAEKTRAWVLYEDAIGAIGVERYEYTGFGEAADLP